MATDDEVKNLAVQVDLFCQLRIRNDDDGILTALLFAVFSAAQRLKATPEEVTDRVRQLFEIFAAAPPDVAVTILGNRKGSLS